MRQSNIVQFGALVDPLHIQIGEVEPADWSILWHLQVDANALTRLAVRGLLNKTERLKAERRLLRKIAKHVSS